MTTTTATLVPCITRACTGRYADLGDHRGYVLASAQDTAGAFALFAVEVDPGGGTPPHLHRREEETFTIQAGRFAFLVGDRTLEAGPGDCVFAPRGIVHAWRCTSDGPGKMLILVTPGANFEAFIVAMAQENIVVPPPAATMARLAAHAERYGVEFLPPVPS